MKIIQNKRYRLLVHTEMQYKNFELKIFDEGSIATVCTVTKDQKVILLIGDTATQIPLTTFIHCVEPVEEPTFDNLVTNVMPKEEWPKVGDEYWWIYSNGEATINCNKWWITGTYCSSIADFGIYRTKEKAQEALEKMKAIARELSGK